MKYVTLRNRIQRLEKRRSFRRSRPPILFTVACASDADIVGIEAPCGPVTERGQGEALSTLASRHAWAAGSARIGYAAFTPGALDFLP